MNILVTVPRGKVRDSFFPDTVIERLEKLGDVRWNDTDEDWTGTDLREHVRDIDICVTGWGTPTFDDEVVVAANRLKLIAHTGGTVAPIVSKAVYERGITVLSGNDLFAESVAEGVICYILLACRDIIKYTNLLRNGVWPEIDFVNSGLLGKTVGLVGYGMVSRHLIDMLKVFHVDIKVCSDHIGPNDGKESGFEVVSLDELFSSCDIISLHLADTPRNYHRIDHTLISSIKDGGLLVNTARGNIIDEKALIRELTSGRFFAVLDVFEQEPLSPKSPLLSMPNVVCIPHMAGPTVDRRPIVTKELVEDIERYLRSEPLKYKIEYSYSQHMTKH